MIHRAGDEARTRDLQLGRLSLYQLSYSRVLVKANMYSGGKWTRTTEPEGADLQSAAIAAMRYPPFVLLRQESYQFSCTCAFTLSHQSGSNQRPTDYKSVALPAELWWLVCFRTFPLMRFTVVILKKDCKNR